MDRQTVLAALRQAQNTGLSQTTQSTDPGFSPAETLKDVGAYGLGAVAAVGNFLDLPGSTVRDLIVGKGLAGSFDQWLSPFSSENRTSGRDLISKVFGVRKNRETGMTGWLKDPGEGVRDLAGFAAEIILDPFGPAAKPLGLGAKLMTGLGKAAGITAKGIAKIPGGSSVLAGTDAARAFVRSKFDQFVGGAKTAQRQAAIAKAMPDLRKFEDEVVGHMVDTLSFINDQNQLVDDPEFVNQVIRHIEGTEQTRLDMLLPNDTFDVNDLTGRPIMSGLKVEDITTRPDGVQVYNAVDSKGARVSVAGDIFQTVKTATDPEFKFLDPKYHPILERWRAGGYLDQRMRAIMEDAAHRTPDLEDVTGINYLNRQMSDLLKRTILDESGRIRTNLGQNGWNLEAEMHRDFIFKDFWGGTPAVNDVFKDKEWNDLVDTIKADNDQYLSPDVAGPLNMSSVFATPSHLDLFADKMGMSTSEFWEELGFKMTKPYEETATVVDALNKYRAQLQANVAGGGTANTVARQVFGKQVFTSLADNNVTKLVHVDNNGVFNFPSSQAAGAGTVLNHNLLDPTEYKNFVDTLEAQGMKRTDALKKANEMLSSGKQVFSWEVDVGKWTPERQYFTPELQSSFDVRYASNLAELPNRIAKNPVRESEVIATALSNRVREKYGHVVERDMPYVNPNGKFEFTDSLGRTREVNISDWTKMKKEDEAAKALGFPPPMNLYTEVKYLGTAKQRMSSRYDAIGDLLEKRSNMRDYQIFGGNPVVLAADMMKFRARAAFVDKRFRELVHDMVLGNARDNGGVLKPEVMRTRSGLMSDAYPASETFGETVDTLLQGRRTTIDKRLFLDKLKGELQDSGLDFGKLTDQEIDFQLLNTVIDPKQMEDIVGLWKYFERSPDSDLVKLIDNASTVMKGNLLATPSTVSRNVMSGVVNAVLTGDINLFRGGLRSLRDGVMLASGKVVQDIPLTPDLESFMKVAGRNVDDPAERSAAFVARFIGAMNRTTAHVQLESTDFASLLKSGGGQNVVDVLPKTMRANMHALGEFWKSQSIFQHLNPLNVPGVLTRENGEWVARSTQNFPVYLSSQINALGDNSVRMSAVLDRMRRGESFDEAFKTVQWHQVSYDSRQYTGFETRVMKRLFPFYSFMSRSIAMTAYELATKPGGGLGMALRAQRIGMGSGEAYVPSDVQDTAAIPLAPGKNGELRYLTNLGLMHEDAVRYLAPTQGVRGILQQLLGSIHPGLKWGIEFGTNTSTFFEGPMGGRRLDDLDPKLGRIVFNLKKKAAEYGITEEPKLEPSGRPTPIGGALGESLVANSPISSYLRYVHTLLDPRRSTGDKFVNLLTGVRTREYSNEAMTREIRDRLNAIEVQMGARPLTTVIGAKGIIEKLRSDGRTEEADRMEAIQQLLSYYRKQSSIADKKTK